VRVLILWSDAYVAEPNLCLSVSACDFCFAAVWMSRKCGHKSLSVSCGKMFAKLYVFAAFVVFQLLIDK